MMNLISFRLNFSYDIVMAIYTKFKNLSTVIFKYKENINFFHEIHLESINL